jgi:cytochrome c5
MRIIERWMRLAILIVGAWLLIGCEKSAPQATESAQRAALDAAPTAPATAPTTPFDVARIFPPGQGRELLLNTCGSCHSVVCVTRGQRTADQWESIKKGHKDKLSASSVADQNAMFSYLAANFNDTKPEPHVPAELQQQGCTPF